VGMMAASLSACCRGRDLGLSNTGASERGAEQVTALVDGVGTDDREDIILDEVLLLLEKKSDIHHNIDAKQLWE
jgi:hypothetical protein